MEKYHKVEPVREIIAVANEEILTEVDPVNENIYVPSPGCSKRLRPSEWRITTEKEAKRYPRN